jgi:ssDNA-binding Zn-finger/Zn-ribbon topoisomerase 1
MNDEDITTWDCPDCPTGRLIRRTNSKTHEKFLGCTNYPKCKYTQKEEKPDAGMPDAASVWE